MSISRLRDPSTRPHQVSDDLESFFWVLLHRVVKCRNSKGRSFKQQMRDVFDQHTEMDHSGIVKGGQGKLYCLYDVELGKGTVQMLVKTPCRKIIEKLRVLFHNFYHFVEVKYNLSEYSDDDEREQKATRVREVTKILSSSKWILEMINRQLSSKWDVDDDSSLHKTVLCLNSAASRDRRKRKAEDSSEEKMTFNQRRKGRLPPRSTGSSGDTGTNSHPHSRSGIHGSKATSRDR